MDTVRLRVWHGLECPVSCVHRLAAQVRHHLIAGGLCSVPVKKRRRATFRVARSDLNVSTWLNSASPSGPAATLSGESLESFCYCKQNLASLGVRITGLRQGPPVRAVWAGIKCHNEKLAIKSKHLWVCRPLAAACSCSCPCLSYLLIPNKIRIVQSRVGALS